MMDPLKALAENAEKLRLAKMAKDRLLDLAAMHGYSVNEMAEAMGEQPGAVRLYMRRHEIPLAKRRQ